MCVAPIGAPQVDEAHKTLFVTFRGKKFRAVESPPLTLPPHFFR